jgi:hypothetical protein
MITFTSSRASDEALEILNVQRRAHQAWGGVIKGVAMRLRRRRLQPKAAAPAEGGGGAEQGQGAGGCCCRCCRGPNDHLDRLTGASKGPSADQACCGEANASQGLAVKRGAANNLGI